jgi:hypothetical protein
MHPTHPHVAKSRWIVDVTGQARCNRIHVGPVAWSPVTGIWTCACCGETVHRPAPVAIPDDVDCDDDIDMTFGGAK